MFDSGEFYLIDEHENILQHYLKDTKTSNVNNIFNDVYLLR